MATTGVSTLSILFLCTVLTTIGAIPCNFDTSCRCTDYDPPTEEVFKRAQCNFNNQPLPKFNTTMKPHMIQILEDLVLSSFTGQLSSDTLYVFKNISILKLTSARLLQPDAWHLDAFAGCTIRALRLEDSLINLPAEAFKYLEGLFELSLSGTDLSNTIDGVFRNVPNTIESLTLDTTVLRKVPTAVLAGLPKLTSLDLQSNKIEQINAGDIPSDKLRELDLSYNPIIKLGSDAFANLKLLETLHLSAVKLSTLDLALLAGLDSLKKLKVDASTELTHIFVSDHVKAPKNLKDITFYGSGLAIIDRSIGVYLESVPDAVISISTPSFTCQPDAQWLSSYALCGRIIAKEAMCADGTGSLEEYLKNTTTPSCPTTAGPPQSTTSGSTTVTSLVFATIILGLLSIVAKH